MRIDVDGRPGEAAAVDDRRVVERVGVDVHAFAPKTESTERLAAKPVGKTHRALASLPSGERRLELGVDRPRPGHEP